MLKVIMSLVALVGFVYAGVNINSATEKELTHLKGVGKVTAEAIVEYRKEHGDFKSVKELAKVKGIGTKTVEKNIAELEL